MSWAFFCGHFLFRFLAIILSYGKVLYFTFVCLNHHVFFLFFWPNLFSVSLGKYLSAGEQNVEDGSTEEEATESILKHANSAAGILCQLKIHGQIQASNVPWMKDVIGIVATLGKLVDDSLSRLV